ncbi:MAG: hypothetical protein GW878_00335 [Acidobacteria bacterium]|nr:hypothetical protein [Acidobacteriota bacterium]
MDAGSFTVVRPDCSDRNNPVFWATSFVCVLGHRFLVRPHVEMNEGIIPLRRSGNAVFLYCGLHRSLWETTGAVTPLHLARMPLPYVAMGDNLIHGKFFQNLSKKIGCFLVERPKTRRDIVHSAVKLRTDVLSFLAHGLDVLIFPEGTRKNVPALSAYGDFHPAAFDALLMYERNKEQIVADNPGLRPLQTYIVPLNVDYSQVREAKEITSPDAATPRTLNVFDSLAMLRHLGDTYLSFGAPIPVHDHLELDRKGLAELCRQRCLDLTRILPVNVAARAMVESPPAGEVPAEVLHAAIARVMAALRPFADRFRGFGADTSPAEIVRRAANRHLDFRRIDPSNRRLYQLYASYIRHLIELPASLAADGGELATT